MTFKETMLSLIESVIVRKSFANRRKMVTCVFEYEVCCNRSENNVSNSILMKEKVEKINK